MLNIAFYQQDIVWKEPKINHQRVKEAFENIDPHCDILVVPETFNSGFGDIMAQMAESPFGPTWQCMHQLAQEHNALAIGTWTVLDVNENGETVPYNRLHWITPEGQGGHYDKGHTFRMSSEASQIQRGTMQQTFEWRGWRIKPAICYDIRFPKWLRNKAIAPFAKVAESSLTEPAPQQALDYDLLLVCANWPGSRSETWTTLLQARAIENLVYVVGVNRVGTDGANIPYSGGSAAYDYCGRTLVRAEDGKEQVCCVSLDREALAHFRSHWPFYLDFD